MGRHVDAALDYARRVQSGEIPACKWARLAVDRQLDDLAREPGDSWPWVFDADRAERPCDFLELLPHIKGKWARERRLIELDPWQCFILTTVFGWVHRDTGLRRFREVYLEIPRKNAKSTLSSGVALYMLTADGEQGAEIYSAATTRDQARIVFDDAKAMAERTPDMRTYLGVAILQHCITVAATASKFAPLAAEGSTLDGLNVHFAVLDELHAHKTRAVYDVIDTARGAREQSLLWNITTAGTDRGGICYERRTHLTKVLERVIDDHSTFGIIYSIDVESYKRSFVETEAISELIRRLKCDHALAIQIAKWWQEICANCATTGSGSDPDLVALITRIDQSRQGDSVQPATRLTESRLSQDIQPDDTKSSLIGQGITQTKEKQPLINGEQTRKTEKELPTNNGQSSTELAESNLLNCLTRKVDDAESVELVTSLCAWITATARERFGASSADNVIRQSAFSEILRKVYSQHSSTFGRQRVSLENNTLIVEVEADDPFVEASWAKANPNWGVSVLRDDMEAASRKAAAMPSAMNNFLTKRLNVWVNGESPWMDMRAWERCADKTLQLSAFAGEPCWMGLDLAQKKDFAALCLVFQRDGVWTVFTRLYLNELAVQESGNAHLSGWARSGYVQQTDGDITDFDVVAEDLRSYCRQFDVQEIAFDPALSMYFAGKLIEEGLPLVEITQRAMFFTPALIQVENMVLEKKLKFDGNPVMTWMVSNLVVKVSKFNELRSPTKERPENKIDGPMAMLMALGRALANEKNDIIGHDYALPVT
jgi:phage terminase large subunit-like protein